MATERLILEVSDGGTTRTVQRSLQDLGTTGDAAAKKVKQGMDESNKSAQGAVAGFNMLQKAIAALGAVISVSKVLEYADAYINLQNRIAVVVKGTEMLAAVQKGIVAVADETRSSVEDTADVYSRLSRASKELGISQQSVLDITRRMNELQIINKGASDGATGGVRALVRALTQGAAMGNDLRIILKDIPSLVDVMAAHFGVSTNAIQKMVASGQVTAEDMVTMFTVSGKAIDDQFNSMSSTIGQAWTKISNHLITGVGAFTQATGAANLLIATMGFLSNHLSILAAVVVPALIIAIHALWAGIAVTPFGAIAIGIGAVIALVLELIQHWDGVVNALRPVILFLAQASGSMAGLFHGLIDGVVVLAKNMPNVVGDIVISAVNGIFHSLNSLMENFQMDMNALLEALEVKAAYWARMVGKESPNMGRVAFPHLNDLENPYAGAAVGAAGAAAKAFSDTWDQYTNGMVAKTLAWLDTVKARVLGKTGGGVLAAAPESVHDSQLKGNKHLMDVDKELKMEQELAASYGIERKALEEKLKFVDSLEPKTIKGLTDEDHALISKMGDQIKEIDLLREKAAALQSIKGVDEDYKNTQTALGELLRDKVISQREYNQALADSILKTQEYARPLDVVWAKFQKMDLSIGQMSGQLGDTLIKSIDSASGALADFAMSGFASVQELRKAFSDLFAAIAKDILKMVIEMLIMKAVMGIAGSFGGGGGIGAEGGSAGISSLEGGGGMMGTVGSFAGGGSVFGGRPILVGETGPEIFVPPGNGQIMPNGGLGGPSPVVQNHINVVLNPDDITGVMNSQSGHKTLINAISSNRETIKKILS